MGKCCCPVSIQSSIASRFIHRTLTTRNILDINLNPSCAQMVMDGIFCQLELRRKLIKRKIFIIKHSIAKYVSNKYESIFEGFFFSFCSLTTLSCGWTCYVWRFMFEQLKMSHRNLTNRYSTKTPTHISNISLQNGFLLFITIITLFNQWKLFRNWYLWINHEANIT